MEKLNSTIGQLKTSFVEMNRVKKNQCMKAIGNTAFCDCVAEKSSVGVSFVGYVSIVAGTKEDFHYDQLSDDDKQMFDATRATRDKCVSWEGKGEGDKLKPAN